MIYNLTGKLTYNDSQFVVINVGGVGFKCFTTVTTSQCIGQIGEEVSVFTYLSVKEDALDLYCFNDEVELEFFKLLISVSGVGPKAAISILSELTTTNLTSAILSSNIKAITMANGIGKKTAERIVIDLKDKVSKMPVSGEISVNTTTDISISSDVNEAIDALVALGYSQGDSKKAVSSLENGLSVDDIIRQSLKILARNL